MKLGGEYQLTLDPLNNQYVLRRRCDGKKVNLAPGSACYNITLLTVEYINRLREQGQWLFAEDIFKLYASHVFDVNTKYEVDDDNA